MTIYAYCNGFESHNRGTWDTRAATAVTTDAAAARTGDYGLKVAPSAQSSQFVQWQASPTGGQMAVGRGYFKFNSFPSGDNNFCTINDSAGEYYALRYESSDSSVVMDVVRSGGGGVSETLQGPVISTGTWYRFDWRCDYVSTNRTIDWAIDGVDQPSATANSSNAIGLFQWQWGTSASTTFTLYADDCVVVWTGDGPDHDTVRDLYPLGPGYVTALYPDGVGTHVNDTSFTTSTGTIADSWQLINDNDNTTYVSQTTIGDTDYLEYTLEATAAGDADKVIQVVTAMWIKGSSGVSSNNAGIHVVDGSNDNTLVDEPWITNSSPPLADFGTVTDGTEQFSPLSATPWTIARLDALKVRWGYSSDVVSIPYLPQAWVEVSFSDVVPMTTYSYWGVVIVPA